ncbi:hypothetical protein [Hirschia baltica]|uniref:Uncharacterized protein n=1 Tax=Hirschia baltica (strain ATCC 49814 / DSM 5838 / IFAM 1418) TaxID=582402 RepID=C6XLB3_HIRBI|nr:hypothetical protein [Hirschia baltica]ACT59712.1 hypothetical protein Hbal_2029 [Hirschia baltica ATCC 49814]
MMDQAKKRLLAAAFGALFGFVGLCGLLAASIIALQVYVGLLPASLIVSAICLSISFGGLYLFLQPSKSSEEEMSDIEEEAADLLADLPVDAAKSMIRKHPIAMTSIAVLAGYSLVTNPSGTTRHLQRILMGLI